MAAIGKIRSWGPALIGVVGLALFAFIAGDLWQSCEATGNEKRMQVGEVLGKKVSVQDFQALVDQYREVIKVTQGRDNLTEDELNGVHDQVWMQFVNNTIMEDETSKLGITVTDEELQNVLKEGSNPILMQSPFVNQQTGRFDVTRLTQFLTDYKSANVQQNPQLAEQYHTIYVYWNFLEKTLRQQLLNMKYQGLLAGCLLSNPISAKASFEADNNETNIKLASVAYSSIADSTVNVSDKDLKAKYDDLKENFKQVAESRDIKYVDFKVVATEEDRNALLATMNQASENLKAADANVADIVRKSQSTYQYTGIPVTKKVYSNDIATVLDTLEAGETTGTFETKLDNTFNVVKLVSKTQMPDSVEIRAIQVVNTTLEATRTTADSIYTALKNGASFEELAKAYGQDGAKQWITSSMYENIPTVDADNKQYIEAINTLSAGETRNLSMSQGNLILQVTDRRAMVDKYVAAVIKHHIDFSKETYSAAYNKFSQFVSESQSIDSLVANAAKYGFIASERSYIQNTSHNVVGIRGTRDALKWIFDADVNEISPLYECGDNNHLLVVALTGIHPVGYSSLEDVKDIIKAEVMKEKKFEQISANLAGVKSVEETAGKGAVVNDVNQITFGAPVFVAATGTSEPALSGAVSALAEGKTSQVIKGNGGAYMFSVVKKNQRTSEKYDEKARISQLQQQALSAASRFMNEMYMKSDVVDKRYMFF